MDWMWGKEDGGDRVASMFLTHRRMDEWCMDGEWLDRWKDGTFTPLGTLEGNPTWQGAQG